MSDEYQIPQKTLDRIRAAQARQRQREAAARARWVLVNEDGHAVEEREGAAPPDEAPEGCHWEASTPGRIDADAAAHAALLEERLAERNRLAALNAKPLRSFDAAREMKDEIAWLMTPGEGEAPLSPPDPVAALEAVREKLENGARDEGGPQGMEYGVPAEVVTEVEAEAIRPRMIASDWMRSQMKEGESLEKARNRLLQEYNELLNRNVTASFASDAERVRFRDLTANMNDFSKG
jgi:hypothetical protein